MTALRMTLSAEKKYSKEICKFGVCVTLVYRMAIQEIMKLPYQV